MIIQLAVPPGVERLAHRVDRVVEPAELLLERMEESAAGCRSR